MMTLVSLVLVAALDRPIPERSCVSLDVRPIPALSGNVRRTWTARQVVDLEIRTSLRTTRNSRPVELRVLTPGGQLYQTLSVSTPTPPAYVTNGRTAPRPVAAARLPVAGTQITQRGLYGLWSVVPYLEGGFEPCGPPASFTLTP
jgi:hypothetical protein